PFYVGINEVKYSWMEEGMAEFLEMKMMQHFYKDSAAYHDPLVRAINYYLRNAGKEWETPLIGPSNHLVYRYMHVQLSYIKPAIMYYILMDLLGERKFLNCYQTYIKRWAGKHPTPYDFIYTFNDVSKENLNWFWKPWIFEYGYPDLSIKEITDSGITIDKIGSLPVPLDLKLSYKNGNEFIIHKTAAIWSSGNKNYTVKIDNPDELLSAELITDKIPDTDKTNNILKNN
ncbi:MAG: M1 family aminopeptidase, partial [Ignavibacteriaceae bacterium]